jgi:hypothetical protein
MKETCKGNGMKPKTKIQKTFVDHGCGFPVVIKNVRMVHVRGVWTPDINYNKLHEAVARALAGKPARLTGNEIKFVRNYFRFTLVEFGRFFDVSHPAVIKWESYGDDTPPISWSLERDLRLFILDQLKEKPKALGLLYHSLKSVAKLPRSNKLTIPSEHLPLFVNT